MHINEGWKKALVILEPNLLLKVVLIKEILDVSWILHVVSLYLLKGLLKLLLLLRVLRLYLSIDICPSLKLLSKSFLFEFLALLLLHSLATHFLLLLPQLLALLNLVFFFATLIVLAFINLAAQSLSLTRCLIQRLVQVKLLEEEGWESWLWVRLPQVGDSDLII